MPLPHGGSSPPCGTNDAHRFAYLEFHLCLLLSLLNVKLCFHSTTYTLGSRCCDCFSSSCVIGRVSYSAPVSRRTIRTRAFG